MSLNIHRPSREFCRVGTFTHWVKARNRQKVRSYWSKLHFSLPYPWIWVLTTLSNMLTNLNLSDMETCYKCFRAEVIKKIKIRSNRFGFEPEVTAEVARLKCRIYEVPISYSGRTYEEGKKITWRDGIAALFHVIRYRFFD